MPTKGTQNKPHAPRVIIPDIPDGFVVAIGPHNKQYLVPNFVLPHLEQEFAQRKTKADLGVAEARGDPLDGEDTRGEMIAEGQILFPACPPLTEQELLNAHAQIIALQHKLGISYKDASHRLYMAQVERLKAADVALKAIQKIDEELDMILRSLSG